MLLLAIDTSARQGSIALARARVEDRPGQGEDLDVLEVVALVGGTFSAQLIPQISELLTKHGFRKQIMGARPGAAGPGSSTVLRIGLAAVKPLAEFLDKPIAA